MYIGLDIGGTKILGGLIDSKKKILNTIKVKTNAADSSQEEIYQKITTIISKLSKDQKLEGIGIGIPGNINLKTGTVEFSPNLPFSNFPLLKKLKADFNVPIAIGNDVNVGLLGEHWAGAASKYKDVVGIFIGTGIGGAVIINNKLIYGKHNIAGEIGHIKIKLDGPSCNCGENGCFEALASKIGMMRSLKKNGIDLDGVLKSSFLKENLDKNNKTVKNTIKKVCSYIGHTIGSLTNVLNPEVFILGGGVIEAIGPYMLKKIQAAANETALVKPLIKLSTLGDDALLFGAVKLISSQNEQRSK